MGNLRPGLRITALIAAVGAAILMAGCSNGDTRPYALAYTDALGRYQGSATVDPSAIDRFVAFFSGSPPDAEESAEPPADAAALADALYADHLYFSDTLLTSEDKPQVVRHLHRMHEATSTLTVTVLDTQQDGADFYVVWRMTAEFTPVRSTITGYSIGITHLRFDADGRIVLQQDFWDASAGFYEHIPVLGSAIRSIRGTFSE